MSFLETTDAFQVIDIQLKEDKGKQTILTLLICVIFLLNSGCGVIVRQTARGIRTFKNSTLFHQGRHGELTEKEKMWAKVAWQYFINNYDPNTGLVNSVDRYPATTMWHIADFLAALVAAKELNIINQHEFDKKLSNVIDFLNKMNLFFGKLPNKVYNTRTGKMVDYANQPKEIGWSAVDIGRLLIWLKIIKCRYPQYAEYVDRAILRWNFCDIIDNEGTLYGGIKVGDKLKTYQEGRLGYEEYAAKGFRLWGFNTKKASDIRPYRLVKIYGINIPCDSRDIRTGAYAPVVSLPFLLDGIEFNWDKPEDCTSADTYHTDTVMADIAKKIYLVQEARYKREHIFTARTDHQVLGPPFFVYDAIFVAGYPWNVISDNGEYHPEAALVSTRASFGMWVLWKTRYTDQLIDIISCVYDPERGWYEGRLEKTGGYMKIITSTTNAMVLEALLYKVEGKIYKCCERSGYYESVINNIFRKMEKCLPIKGK